MGVGVGVGSWVFGGFGWVFAGVLGAALVRKQDLLSCLTQLQVLLAVCVKKMRQTHPNPCLTILYYRISAKRAIWG